jgi:CheY-like chemotaxis protein
MGISVRQLRRQQNEGILELACRLWNQHGLDSKPDYAVQTASPDSRSEKDSSSQIAEELGWLKNSSLQGMTDLTVTLPEVLNLIQPLAELGHTQIICQSQPGGLVSVHPVAFQEILLNLLSLAMHYTPGSEVRLEIMPSGRDLIIQISGSPAVLSEQQLADAKSRMQVVSQLVQLSQGKVEFSTSNQQFRSSVTFQSIPPLSVLVIDDNPEMVTVMQRFAAETRYRVMGINNPKFVVEQAAELDPDIIVLDIMMPQIDGLQVLSRLKHHPELGKIPVIICSVLPQTDLAASLGASGFIQKPFQRDTFIATLNQHSREME